MDVIVSSKRAPALALVLLCTVLAVVPAAAQQVRECGYDRWPVKVLTDKDRQRVDFRPQDTTIAKLGAIPIHEIPYPRDRRMQPEEFRVYRVRAVLLRVKTQRDCDVHLLLADPANPESRMIAEIPAPECALGSGHEDQYRTAREALRNIPVGTQVELVGVGFFDFLHEQRGAAKNGMELHPALSISRVEPQSQ